MINKLHLYPLYLIILLFTINSEALTPATDDEQALYALSSLACHMKQQLINESKVFENLRIQFQEDEIARLWKRALMSEEAARVKEAKHYYRLSQKSSNQQQSRSLLEKAHAIALESWERLNPFHFPASKNAPNQHYLLPSDHWLKFNLDNIFTQTQANKNQKLFKKAGFIPLCKRSSGMIVAKHEDISGYLIKVYLESDKPNLQWKWLMNRCLGAENIRKLIQKKQLRYFTVPDKWIYPLPSAEINTENMAVIKEETYPAVLVVTHMQIESLENSKAAWKNKITHRHLQELYCILSHGFASCYLPQNIPYTKNGQFTCIDTEYPFRNHRLERIKSKLSEEMAEYWDYLVRTGGGY
ncbi:MAG: hypothetical protein ACXU9U_05095 [Parachlamydiaceae bacterium]